MSRTVMVTSSPRQTPWDCKELETTEKRTPDGGPTGSRNLLGEGSAL